jgi:hypothetical protein
VSIRHRQIQSILCEVCGKSRHVYLKGRDICRDCYHAEASTRCARCGLMKHGVSQETGLCPHCAKIAARPQNTCTKCSRFTVIYNQHNWVCQPCHELLLWRVRSRARGEVECSVCGEVRPSQLTGRAICQACWRAERNGRDICVRCKRLKIIGVKAERLCKQCYKDHLAPKALRVYVENFTTLFP